MLRVRPFTAAWQPYHQALVDIAPVLSDPGRAAPSREVPLDEIGRRLCLAAA